MTPDDGQPWGFIEDGVWIELPKVPMLAAGLGPPPFRVYGRDVIHRPADAAPTEPPPPS